MHTDDHVGSAEALVEVVGEHGAGAVDGLFGRLADEHDRAVPLALCLGESAGGADEDGGVYVVSAGMHDASVLTGLRFGHDVAGVGDTGLFDDGQRVHVGADEEGWAGAVLQDADDAVGLRAVGVDADVVADGVAGLAQLGGEEGGGACLVVRELGMGVDLLVGIDEVGELLLLEGDDVLGEERRDNDGQDERQQFLVHAMYSLGRLPLYVAGKWCNGNHLEPVRWSKYMKTSGL